MMKHLLSALALLALVLAFVPGASAVVQRTFVSKYGVDTNPCSATEPCRTFGAAIAQTQSGGEVIALDSAGYGPVTITQAISLIAPPGVYAGISTTVPFSNAITVSAGSGDVVVLRGLSLNGLGIGDHGVHFTSGKALRVEGLTISGFAGNGIYLGVAATTLLGVSDTIVRDTGGAGIVTYASLGEVRGAINRVTLQSNGRFSAGVHVGQGGRITVRDSVATQSLYGFVSVGPSSVLNVENCLATGNLDGLASFDGIVRVAGTTVTENTEDGLHIIGSGGIFSRGNNTVEGNAGNQAFTAVFAAK